MRYVYELPSKVSFRGKGLFGYSFGPMQKKNLEVIYIESETGHDTFMILHGVLRIYYILAGNGSFTIDGQQHRVGAGSLVEIPSNVEYCYSGRMTMLAFCERRWFSRKDTFTRWNRDVVGEQAPLPLNDASWAERIVRLRVFGKSLTNAFLRVNRRVWNILAPSASRFRPIEWYGRLLHALARTNDIRAQALNTFFLRNRPELQLIQHLVSSKKEGETIRVAILGCSTGAEVYSVMWAIRTARPDLKLVMNALDVSGEAVEFAQRGVYPLKAKMTLDGVRDCMAAGRWRGEPGSELVDSEQIFERLTATEKAQLFEFNEHSATVKDWLKEGISWGVADVRELKILGQIGPQDIVIASNFLCHMEKSEAERCLRNIARLVHPEGYLFVSGIDLDIRAKVARDLGWEPIADLLEEIHDGDSCLRGQWPLQYTGLEPLNKRRSDWKTRYAAAFQVLARTDGKQLGYDTKISEENLETRSSTL